MKRVGFLLKVKPEKIQEYRERHRAVWPEMQEALRRNGWHNYSLFMREDGTIFGYVEVEDSFAAVLKGMDQEEINTRWQTYMDGFFQITPGLHADQAMLELEEVFHLD
ncbi:L-rhamnose mutarotase [Dictyobacter aurantiacus]|uniref:L-rhamnose mutarotase n=1 Tax=Dictyobacter aurantiacus TaxID=1936993 RepID=A0A401Z7N9_9CHLR|nr:L-rhamnose mutarotase [Dictyobacter aurantiacus]GCE02880.1 L-rhamnose mutarotase [Dictyobacter aurantiacus]